MSRCAAMSRSRGGCGTCWPRLVKIEPKAIGVGQCQHDVDQHRLGRALEAVVEDAVNAVGVDLNMASAALLAHVSGLGPALAGRSSPIATRRARSRAARTCSPSPPRAARLRAMRGLSQDPAGAEPLDRSAVHPGPTGSRAASSPPAAATCAR